MDVFAEPVYDYRKDELMLQSMYHLDELLRVESLPPFPFLHREFSDIATIDEIRRTLVAANIDESVSGQELLDFFGNAGEVKYVRFCLRRGDPIRYCLIEFSSLMSIVNGLKLNNQTFCGRVIKVYHSTESIEKPSYLKDPESFKQCLLELKSHVEDSFKVVQKAAKDVSEYEEYCIDSQPTSKPPLKNPETAIAEIEEALSKVLSAQSLISVAISPVEPQLLSILGETFGDKESIPSSPESLLKYLSQKPNYFGEDGITGCLKESSKSKSLDPRSSRRRHRTRSRSRERNSKYHGHSSSGCIGKSHRYHQERSRSHDNRSRRHAKHSSVHHPVVSSKLDGHSSSENSHSEAHKLNDEESIGEDLINSTKETGQDMKATVVKSVEKVTGNETEKENDQERSEVVSKSTLQADGISSEKVEIPCEKDVEEGSVKKSRLRVQSGEHPPHHDRRSKSRSPGGRRRSSSQREHHKSPVSSMSSRRRSPPSCEKGRRGLHKRRSRSPSSDCYHHHHHHHHVSSLSRCSEADDRSSRRFAGSSSRGERRRRDDSRERHHSSHRRAKSHCLSPRHHRSSPRHGSSKHSRDEVSRENRSHRHSGHAVVMVYPESYEDYLEEEKVELEEAVEEAQSSQSEDMSKTETASGSGSQDSSIHGGECED